MQMRIMVKNYGEIEIELNPHIAPLACAKVKNISKLGRYNGRRVERLEPGFVFQPLFYDGTDPVMDEEIELEAKTIEANGAVHFTRGTVAMAGTQTKASAAQYFITLQPKDRLNGNFTVIGSVISGWDILKKIESAPVDEEKLECGVFHYPKEDIIIESVTIDG